MTPLTVDCARVRQLLPDLLDRPAAPLLPPDPGLGATGPDLAQAAAERAFAEEHLRACAGCRQAREQIAGALGALEQLSPEDAARLRALADGELDVRPLARLSVAVIGVVLLLALGVVLVTAPRRQAPAPRTSAAAPAGLLALPRVEVGAEVGIELELELVAPPIELPWPDAAASADLTDAGPEAGEAPPAGELPAVPELGVALAPPADPAAPAPAGRPDAPARPARLEPPPPAPAEVAAMLARLELSQGARFREVTFFFVRDPSARDRLGRGRAPVLPIARESSPPEPGRCVVRPPSGASSYGLLAGELLDAPCGLRLATAARRLSGRSELEVAPAGFDGLGAIEGRTRREPVLRGPVLVTSRARAALIEGAEPGPVAVFLEALADPSLLDFARLRRELGRLEAEARDLERRLRPALEDQRGLRGVGFSIGQTARSIDVFASSRDLGDALPRLLRAALLEAALERPEDDQALGADPRSATIAHGVTETRERHQALLAALAGCRRRAGADDLYERVGGAEVGAIWTAGQDLLTATVVSRP